MSTALAWTRRNAIALLALFVALGGTGYAATAINGKLIKHNTVAGTKLKKDTLGAREIKESKLATVPRASRADSASAADRATSASTATSAASATNAGNADRLDGVDSTGFLRSTVPEPYREVGSAGQPLFGSGWANEAAGTNSTVAFYKDPFGVVHLKGVATRSAGAARIFTLPAGHTPTQNACFPTVNAAPNPPAPAHVCIFATGVVQQITGAASGAYLLDGIAFRAGAQHRRP